MIPRVVDFFDSLIPRASGGALTLNDPNGWDEWIQGAGAKSDSGIRVCAEDALRFGPVVQCLEIKSGDVGVATMHIHKNNVADGEDDIDTNQSAERVCSLEWNEYMPANEGWQNLVFHNQLWGDGFAYIAHQGGAPNGPIQWMANLPPTRVEPFADTAGNLMYKYSPEGDEPQILYPWEIFHLRSLAITAHRSLKMLKMMRNELGLALAAKLFLSKFFQRGGHHGGILQIKQGTSAPARKNLEEGVEKRADPNNWFKTMILRDGAEWQSSTVDPRTAQMHELTDDEARAVCHFFNVPPWKLGIRDSASYNSAEQSQTAYITGTLQHVCTRIAGEANIKLITDRTRRARSHRFEHNFSKLLQSDVKTLNQVLEIQRRNEVINANDWRKKINLPRRADKKADEYYNPNTKTDKKKAQTKPEPATATSSTESDTSDDSAGDEGGNSGSRLSGSAEAIRKMVDQAMVRATRRLVTICRNKSRKPNDLLAWCDSSGTEHASILAEELEISLQCCFSESRATVILMATQTWLFGGLTAGVGQYLEAPHKPADLASAVDAFCTQFLETVCDRWKKEILDANQ